MQLSIYVHVSSVSMRSVYVDVPESERDRMKAEDFPLSSVGLAGTVEGWEVQDRTI